MTINIMSPVQAGNIVPLHLQLVLVGRATAAFHTPTWSRKKWASTSVILCLPLQWCWCSTAVAPVCSVCVCSSGGRGHGLRLIRWRQQ